MGTTNHGTQDITYNYYEKATAEDFNKRHLENIPRGIYQGGHLKKVSNSEITLSLFTVEIGDDDEQISSKSSMNATLNSDTLDSGSISSDTSYIIFRWAFAEQSDNYVEVHAIANVASAQANDIIVGKCVFIGATLDSFDYTDRTLLNVQNIFLRVEPTEDVEMKIWVRGGRIHTATQCVVVPEQKVGPFAVPGSPNSRIDLVYINIDGSVSIKQGTQAVSPLVPDYESKLVIAEVTLVNGATNIVADGIKDVRSPHSNQGKNLNQYLSTYNSAIQLPAVGIFKQADLGTIKNQSGIVVASNRITLTAGRKYLLSYGVEGQPTAASVGDPTFQAKWVVVSGDSSWNLEEISLSEAEAAEDDRVKTHISITCYIIPSITTVIELQIFTNNTTQKAEISRVITNIVTID